MADHAPSWEEVIARYGLQLRARSGQLRGRCPIHGGTNPTSLVITPGRGFYCHACGAGGGIATFIELMDSPDRARDVARPWEVPQGRAVVPLDLDRFAEGRYRALADLPTATPLSPLDAAHPYLRKRGVTLETAHWFGCGYLGGDGSLAGRIVFPVSTPDGRVVGHVGRSIGNRLWPRYRFSTGLRKGLLLLHEEAVTIMEPVIVVEGPFDAMAVDQAGFRNVVALLGCRATGHQLAPLAWYPRVIVLLDDDDAGRAGAIWIAAQLGRRAVVVHLPGDPAGACTSALAELLLRTGAGRTATSP